MKLLLIIPLVSIFLISCSKKITVDGAKITSGYVESTVNTINSGTVNATKQAELAFGTVGRIQSLHVSLGAKVEQGAVIAEIENQDLKAIYSEAQKENDRSLELFKNGLVSTSNLDSAKRAFEVAKTSLEKTMIKAPFKGMITALDLKVGEFYQNPATAAQKPKVQIIDLEKRIVKGEIDEIDLPKVKLNQMARIKIPAYKNQIFNAKVNKVVPFVSTAKDQDRTSEIELTLLVEKGNENILIPVGASADVEIITDKKENVLIAPTSYLQGVGKNKFVYKIIDGKLTKTNIVVGVNNYERSEILEGLKKDDIIARPPDGIDDVNNLKVEVVEKKWP